MTNMRVFFILVGLALIFVSLLCELEPRPMALSLGLGIGLTIFGGMLEDY